MADKMKLHFSDVKQRFEHFETDEVFDLIICITRGGLMPAGLLAYKLNIKDIVNVKIESYEDTCLGGTQHSIKLDSINDFDLEKIKNAEKVLIVDDIYDTGLTIKTLKYELAEHFDLEKFKTFCIVEKRHGAVDYSLFTITDDSWIVFPWDF